jgi:hypothetical protein
MRQFRSEGTAGGVLGQLGGPSVRASEAHGNLLLLGPIIRQEAAGFWF